MINYILNLFCFAYKVSYFKKVSYFDLQKYDTFPCNFLTIQLFKQIIFTQIIMHIRAALLIPVLLTPVLTGHNTIYFLIAIILLILLTIYLSNNGCTKNSRYLSSVIKRYFTQLYNSSLEALLYVLFIPDKTPFML